MLLSTLNRALESNTSTPKIPLILCYYTNVGNKLQILRLENISEDLNEKIIFPGQRILFQALPGSILKIYAGAAEGEKFIDQIQCQHLRVYQGNDY